VVKGATVFPCPGYLFPLTLNHRVIRAGTIGGDRCNQMMDRLCSLDNL
jgi:hypothetical protein